MKGVENIIKIPLTKNYYLIIDEKDFNLVSKHKWRADDRHKKCTVYAITDLHINKKRTTISVHRLIMKPLKTKQVDHVNGNGLDNRRCNLRVCTHSQNQMNKRPKLNSEHKFKGIFWIQKISKWKSSIYVNGKGLHLGLFSSEIKAAKAYDKSAKKHFKEFAKLNFN